MIHLINFANDKFTEIQEESSRNAKRYGGIDKVWECKSGDISPDFLQENASIFSYKRGYGLWLWKPYLINKLLNILPDNDFLVYADAGITILKSLKPLFNIMERDNIEMMFFDLPLLEREWTKGEAYKNLKNYREDNLNQIDGSFFILKNSLQTREFINQWLVTCQKEEYLSPKRFTDMEDDKLYQSHREDQALLSILVHNRELVTYRDPSDYGEFPYQYSSTKWTYCPKIYNNCDYPTLILHNRSVPAKAYKRKYLVKHILSKVGLWPRRNDL